MKVAYTLRHGLVTIRETIGKFVLCAIQIGSGASLGLEGPTVQVCAGVSSMLARLARLGPNNSRRMASVGMAAGIAAAFNAPIAAVTFTLEELIGDLDQTMLSGGIVAAALAAVVEHSILGSNPVFHVQANYTLTKSSSLVWYALLGLLAAIVSVAFTDSLLGLRAWFRRHSPLPVIGAIPRSTKHCLLKTTSTCRTAARWIEATTNTCQARMSTHVTENSLGPHHRVDPEHFLCRTHPAFAQETSGLPPISLLQEWAQANHQR